MGENMKNNIEEISINGLSAFSLENESMTAELFLSDSFKKSLLKQIENKNFSEIIKILLKVSEDDDSLLEILLPLLENNNISIFMLAQQDKNFAVELFKSKSARLLLFVSAEEEVALINHNLTALLDFKNINFEIYFLSDEFNSWLLMQKENKNPSEINDLITSLENNKAALVWLLAKLERCNGEKFFENILNDYRNKREILDEKKNSWVDAVFDNKKEIKASLEVIFGAQIKNIARVDFNDDKNEPPRIRFDFDKEDDFLKIHNPFAELVGKKPIPYNKEKTQFLVIEETSLQTIYKLCRFPKAVKAIYEEINQPIGYFDFLQGSNSRSKVKGLLLPILKGLINQGFDSDLIKNLKTLNSSSEKISALLKLVEELVQEPKLPKYIIISSEKIKNEKTFTL
jgi:hypothetical protein